MVIRRGLTEAYDALCLSRMARSGSGRNLLHELRFQVSLAGVNPGR